MADSEEPDATRRQIVRDRLRRDILEFRLQPGQHLIERELIEQLGASRTTVREALRELSSVGLVTVYPQRGAFVASLTPAEASDLYDARAALGALTIRYFVERAQDACLDAVDAAVADFAALSGEDPFDGAAAMDAYDHVIAAVYAGASSPVEQFVEAVHSRTRVLGVQSMDPDRHAATTVDLRELAASLRARDADRAVAAYTRQLMRAKANVLHVLEA